MIVLILLVVIIISIGKINIDIKNIETKLNVLYDMGLNEDFIKRRMDEDLINRIKMLLENNEKAEAIELIQREKNIDMVIAVVYVEDIEKFYKIKPVV